MFMTYTTFMVYKKRFTLRMFACHANFIRNQLTLIYIHTRKKKHTIVGNIQSDIPT